MRELHHFGIPTAIERENETYLEGGKLFVTDAAASPNKIEWLRFEEDSPMPELLKTASHIAYKVQDIQKEMEGKPILLEPFSPMPGLTVAFIIEEGLPIELMQEG
jgi:hypothetical protein